MRYFAKLGADNEAINIYRFERGETAMVEDRWDIRTKSWMDNPDADVVRYLTQGEGEFQEVTEEVARQIFPDVFTEETTKALGKFDLQKAEGEKRYTLGAMYIPDMEDAHGEWTDSDELQRAVWDYVRGNDRRIRLQHNRDVVAGEWVEVMAFPYSLTVPIKTPEGQDLEHTYPPNTVFLGVIWEPWAWDMVTEGKIRGYSIGGKAERLFVDIDLEKNDPTVSDVHVDTIMNPKKKKKILAMEKSDTEEVIVEKEKPLDIEALTKTIIESIKKDIPAPAPVVVENAPAVDMEAMMVRLAEIFAANKPIVNVTLPEEKPKNRRVERDEFGNISRIIEEG
jgi:hypothetical protein